MAGQLDLERCTSVKEIYQWLEECEPNTNIARFSFAFHRDAALQRAYDTAIVEHGKALEEAEKALDMVKAVYSAHFHKDDDRTEAQLKAWQDVDAALATIAKLKDGK